MSGTTLRLGDGFPKFHPERSVSVKELQRMLKKWGYPINETGHFDWMTDGAVLHFQRQAGLTADAQVLVDAGRTWPALKKTPTTLVGQAFSVADLGGVPFISQFDPIHVIGAGQKGCFAAAETMLRAVGVKQAGPSNKFQVITKETWKNGVPTQQIDAVELSQGKAYLDAELASGRPVMVGVSYSNEAAEGDGINEKITEHFVVIIEMVTPGTYLFHDPATGISSLGANRQFTTDLTSGNLVASGIPGYAGYAIGAQYDVSVIRKNDT